SASNEDALTDQSRQSFAKGITARLVMALLIVLWVSPNIFIYVQLVTPIPIPKQPDDNSGWESLTSAGIEAETSPYIDLLERGVAPTQTELTEAVNALSPVYVLLDLGLNNPIKVPIDYTEIFVFGEDFHNQQAIVKALKIRGRLAEEEERFGDAADCYLQAIRLGFAARHGGYVLQQIGGSAVASSGMAAAYRLRNFVPIPESVRIIDALSNVRPDLESVEVILHRERIGGQRNVGWPGHLAQILDELREEPESAMAASVLFERRNQELTELRLLQLEFAVRAFRLEKGRLPQSLTELVPKYLSAIPADPFSANHDPLKYLLTENGYRLYSVSKDGVDDRGEMSTWEGQLSDLGDFQLEIRYYDE
ncbi:MAG: hypothetical protein AAGI63_08405, partial [Planctomycetota bacterium]